MTHLALATVSLMFGISYVLTKIVLASIPAPLWAWYRVTIAALTVLPFAFKPGLKGSFREPLLWASAIFGIVLNQLFFVEGLARTTPAHSALINACLPAVTLTLGILLGRDRWNFRRACGIACAILGVAILIGPPQGGKLAGDALTILNVTCFATFLVISKPLTHRYPTLGLTARYLLIGVFFMGLNAGVREFTDPEAHSFRVWLAAPPTMHLLMLVVAVQSTTIPYVLNNWALKRATPSQVATYVTLQPLVAAALSHLITGDKLRANFYPAFVLVVFGVLLSAFTSQRKTGPRTAPANS